MKLNQSEYQTLKSVSVGANFHVAWSFIRVLLPHLRGDLLVLNCCLESTRNEIKPFPDPGDFNEWK